MYFLFHSQPVAFVREVDKIARTSISNHKGRKENHNFQTLRTVRRFSLTVKNCQMSILFSNNLTFCVSSYMYFFVFLLINTYYIRARLALLILSFKFAFSTFKASFSISNSAVFLNKSCFDIANP